MGDVSETRVYEVERLTCNRTWEFVGNLEVEGYTMLARLVDRAERDDWQDGEYRLLHWDKDFASGSFYLVTLRCEKHRRAEMHKPAEREEAA